MFKNIAYLAVFFGGCGVFSLLLNIFHPLFSTFRYECGKRNATFLICCIRFIILCDIRKKNYQFRSSKFESIPKSPIILPQGSQSDLVIEFIEIVIEFTEIVIEFTEIVIEFTEIVIEFTEIVIEFTEIH